MTQFIDTFPAHFLIEMRHNRKGNGGFIFEQTVREEEKKLLFEKFGIFDGCEELAINIEEICIRAYNDGAKSFIFKPRNKCIADNIIVEFVPGFSCGFVPDSVITNGETYDKMHLKIATGTLEKGRLIPSIMHELIHAYENLMRIKHKAKSITQKSEEIGYQNSNVDAYSAYDGLQKYIAQLLYYLTDFERNAYVSQIYGEASKCGKIFDNAEDAMEWIRQTIPYRNYQTIFNVANGLCKISDDVSQKNIVSIANKLSKHNFKNYKNFIGWLEKKVNKYSKKFNEILPKIAAKELIITETLSPPIDYLIEDTLKQTLDELINNNNYTIITT